MARILVVDDDEAVLATMKKTLVRAGYVVETASNGDDGLKRYRAAPSDLVITDLYMPEKEGIETIQDLRADFPEALILAISGGGLAGTGGPLMDAELFGANATLAKPFTPDELVRTVARLLA
jgi:CheY-like chemotaxis protein